MDPSDIETPDASPPLVEWASEAGARAAERRLLDEVEACLDAENPRESLRAPPLRLVVPSRSLREHLSRQVLLRRGRSVLGLRVQTHRSLALEALEAAGEPTPGSELLVPLLAQRLVGEEPALVEALGGLEGGVAALASTLTDFFDAGFEADQSGVLLDALEAGTGSSGDLARARSLVRLARRLAAQCEALGVGHASAPLVRATQLLDALGADLLPTRRLWLHGYADLTGVGLAWAIALLRNLGGCVIVDRPPDPAEPERTEEAFTAPLVAALSGAGRERKGKRETERGGARLALLACEGPVAEVRGVAERVRALLDEGVLPEDIAIVARHFTELDGALAVQLEKLGIPFSTAALAAESGELARRARALLELLRRGASARPERWLDAHSDAVALDPDLRLAVRAAGVLRLAEVVRFDPMPRLVARAVRAVAAERALACLAGRARRLLRHLESWPARAALADHLVWLRELFATHLEWEGRGSGKPFAGPAVASDDQASEAWEQLDSLARGLPPSLVLDREELVFLLARLLERWVARPRGGRGAGVPVLSVMEARGRTARHLFVMGLNRGVFPRPLGEDPLLPDAVRRPLRSALPALPVKSRGRDEERHLFAELLSSSPSVTLSWQASNAAGRARPVSPLVVRLRLAHLELEPERVATPDDAGPEGAKPLVERPAHEHCLRAALAGGMQAFEALLPLALEELRGDPAAEGSPPVSATAAARAAVVRELERDPEPRGGAGTLGPYFGFLGPAFVGADEDAPPFVTGIEGLLRCPWRHFLGRTLRVEGLPAPPDELASAGPRLTGTLVHRVLERIVRDALGASDGEGRDELQGALARGPCAVAWPDAGVLEALLHEEARRITAEEGVAYERLAPIVADHARACLEVARDVDWATGGSVAVLGAEVEGEVDVTRESGRRRLIRFRADRVDLAGSALRATDYKTGKPISEAKGGGTRARHFLRAVRAGRNLQASAYLEALRQLEPGRAVDSRYLFLGAAVPREFAVPAGDADWSEAFRAACVLALEAREHGVVFPRLVQADLRTEPSTCETCEVRLACLRGEGTQRARLVHWARTHACANGALDPPERVLVRVLRLGAKPGADEDRSVPTGGVNEGAS